MNVFYTDECPIKAANNLCKVHINSQFKESNQMLSTTLRLLGIEDDRLCKTVQPNHPSTKWVRESIHHYNWLVAHVKALQSLVNKPTGHDARLEAILSYTPDLPDNGFTPPPKVVNTDEYPTLKTSYVFDNVTVLYKKYLKTKYHHWTTRTNKRKVKVEFVNGIVPDYLGEEL